MQLVFPDDEAIQPHLKLLDMAKRWKKGQDEVAATTTTTTIANTTTIEDDVPLPESRVDDEEMNDES
jgi:phosphomannomutase